ncbi:MAG TPA: membrane dipeptidase [Acidothermales bacterium]
MPTPNLVWDQHTCLPLRPDANVELLTRYARPGGCFTSVNVGYSPHSGSEVHALLDAFQHAVATHPLLDLAVTVNDVRSVTTEGRIAVAFDLEDSAALGDDLDALHVLAQRGVRAMLPTYNHANAAGCGCLDTDDTGLTTWGRDLVAEMNAAGVVVDGSHCSARTGLDLCDVSEAPVIYSHSCLQSVWQHPRNITDDQARACAATGGVVGITGVGIFLGPNSATLEAMVRHLEVAVELVGVNHVGVSTDFAFDHADFGAELAANPELFDDSYIRWGPIEFMPPEVFLGLDDALASRGWPNDDITAVLSGNFMRVAEQTWPRAS